jgi:hypothetical protein
MAMKKMAMLSMVLALGVTAAYAHEGMHGPGSEYDADANGSLSVEEYKAYLKEARQDVSTAAAKFAALDTNKDGKLSSAEFARGQPAKAK